MGHKLVENSRVWKHIEKRMKDREQRTEITQDKVLKELADIAFDDIKNYLSFKQDGDNVKVNIKDSKTINTKNIAEISIGKDGQFKFKLYCKDTALVNVGKHLGMFVDRTENKNENINQDITMLSREERKKRITELRQKLGETSD
jgi:phage terminase small subunit